MEGPRDCHTEWSNSETEEEIFYDIPYMWNLKRSDTNDFAYKTEAVSQTWKKELMVNLWGKGSWRDRLQVWDRHGHTAIFEINSQQGPTV